MNRFAFGNQGMIVRLVLALLILAFVTDTSNAHDIVSGIANDATTRQLAAGYSIIAVREAIAECRAGKFDSAVPVLKKYAAQNDVGATYVLANLYVDGLGVEVSAATAIELLTRNVAGDHTPSMVRLGLLKEKQSPAEALQLFKQASAGNDAMADLKLGQIFETGMLGARANPKLAFKYYDQARQRQHVLGTFHTARCYDEGIGVSPNAIESTRLFRQAAMAGAGLANAVMARRYFEGKGVEADPVAAVGWLMRGSQAGDSDAMVLLGQRYETGDVIGRDLNRAGQLYSAAASGNDPVGRYCLAMMYLNGTGTQKDIVRAYVLLAAAQSYPKAKTQFDKLSKEMSAEQLSQARKKITEDSQE